MFVIAGEVALRIENLKSGNEITQTMPSGELVIGETVTPFVLQRKVRGNINQLNMSRSERVGIILSDQLRATTFTKQGYVSLLLTIPHGRFYVYIKKEKLEEFRVAFRAAARASFEEIIAEQD